MSPGNGTVPAPASPRLQVNLGRGLGALLPTREILEEWKKDPTLRRLLLEMKKRIGSILMVLPNPSIIHSTTEAIDLNFDGRDDDLRGMKGRSFEKTMNERKCELPSAARVRDSYWRKSGSRNQPDTVLPSFEQPYEPELLATLAQAREQLSQILSAMEGLEALAVSRAANKTPRQKPPIPTKTPPISKSARPASTANPKPVREFQLEMEVERLQRDLSEQRALRVRAESIANDHARALVKLLNEELTELQRKNDPVELRKALARQIGILAVLKKNCAAIVALEIDSREQLRRDIK